MDELVPVEKVLAPVVHSTANPGVELLLQMRAIVSKDKDLEALFIRSRKEQLGVEWLRDQLAAHIYPLITVECLFEDIVQASLYLADEYNQLGEGYLIISTETGRAVSVLTEDDLYDPGLMARHGGSMAPALQRIKPGTETMLVSYAHEKSREEQVLARLKEKYPQTALLREEGDNRFRIATRSGRKGIAQELAGDDPRELLRRSGGTTGMFLRHFPLVDDFEDDPESVLLAATAAFRSQLNVPDPLAINISHNRLGTLRGAAPQGWVRDICRTLAETAHKTKRALPVPIEDLTFGDLDGVELWIVDPDIYKEMLKIHPSVQAVPVEGVDPIGLKGVVGHLFVPREFTVESQERFNRWEVVANLPFQLIVDFDKIRILPISGISREAVLV